MGAGGALCWRLLLVLLALHRAAGERGGPGGTRWVEGTGVPGQPMDRNGREYLGTPWLGMPESCLGVRRERAGRETSLRLPPPPSRAPPRRPALQPQVFWPRCHGLCLQHHVL